MELITNFPFVTLDEGIRDEFCILLHMLKQ